VAGGTTPRLKLSTVATLIGALGSLVAVLTFLGISRPGSKPATPASTVPSAPASSSTTALSATDVHIFQPFSDKGVDPHFQVLRDVQGSCFVGSSTDIRREAWRCNASDNLYDPCFQSPYSSSDNGVLACPLSPFEDKIVLLHLTRPLPFDQANKAAGTTGNPWAMKLPNGDQCVYTGGASGALSGMRLNYQCNSGSGFGDVDRTQPVWRVFYQVKGSNELPQVPVATAYF